MRRQIHQGGKAARAAARSDNKMRISNLVDSAANFINSIPPANLSATFSAAVAFLLSLFLLRDVLAGAAAGTQLLAASLGGLIAAFLASRLAAYLMRVIALRPGWPDMTRARQMVVALLVALASAAVVLAIMVAVS
jgi:uncharacterized membrane protein